MQEFQYATPGQPLLEILDDRSIEVELIAPSRWLAWLNPGYVLRSTSRTDKTYKAAITRVGGPGRSGQPDHQGVWRDPGRSG